MRRASAKRERAQSKVDCKKEGDRGNEAGRIVKRRNEKRNEKSKEGGSSKSVDEPLLLMHPWPK